MRTIGKVTAVITLLCVICVAIFLHVLNPTWGETYSYENDSLIVMNDRVVPTEEALVVQVTGKTGWHGGWGCPGTAPAKGGQVYGSLREQFAVRSFVSDSGGRVPFKPFVTQGQGRKRPTVGHTKNGFVEILVYKRGYVLREIRSRPNDVQDSRIRIIDHRSRSPIESGLDDVLKLLCPFNFADTAMQRLYWSHILPNGLTVQDYALDELEAILETITNEGQQVRTRQAIERIESEDFEGYPTNFYQLTKPSLK